RLRHSTSHVMADAVTRLFPEARVAIGPSTADGFYYDFDVPHPFSDEDLERIEEEMRKIIAEDLPFTRQEISRSDAIALFGARNERFKVELAEGIPEGETISLFGHGGFTDLCRGPHVERTGEIKAFKLTGVAGAYWRGNERNPMLQRIYGTAFESDKELRVFLQNLEEARKRDHRKLGRELDLFSTSPDEIGGGLILWHPRGGRIRTIIEDFWKRQHLANGYDLVYTPHIARDTLWHRSGHLQFYKDAMFSGMDVDGQQYLAKPMNCPYHISIYNSRLRSYRELPMRWAELGTVYRYERGGTLHGLFRVRGFTQDDAHLFFAREQMASELDRVLGFSLFMLRSFGFRDFELNFSTRPPSKYAGTDEIWDDAEAELRAALERSGVPYVVDEGGGAFYGPKIDIKLTDSLRRQWQLTTIQLDFVQPENFDLLYVGADNTRHRPVMIHRALLGSLERFFGILIEHYGGKFPLWLSPVQVKVLTVTDRHEAFALEVVKRLESSGLRAEADLRNEKLGFKIREAQMEKHPYMLVVGDKEVEQGMVAPRPRDKNPEPAVPLEGFVERLCLEAAWPTAQSVADALLRERSE
ncbi:MAG: threonine--tRNA ligase, partial [Polyangia bacterium]|nr:threonine--tRNA ligase [Polyangia bacterium]